MRTDRLIRGDNNDTRGENDTRDRGDAGFTTVEAIVAIAIIAAAGAMLAMASSVAFRTLIKTHDGVITSADCLSTDAAIRAAVGRVRIPWWESRAKAELSAEGVTIPWLDGIKENTITLSVVDGHLVILSSVADSLSSEGSGETAVIYRTRFALDDVSFSALSLEDKTVRGIEVTYTKGNATVTCDAPFASFAMGKQ